MRNDPAVIQSYSEALFNLAKRKNLILQLFEEADAFIRLHETNRRLEVFLEGPHIEDSEKHHLIDEVFKTKIHECMLNLLHILVDNHRTEYLDDILKDFSRRVQLFKNIYPATIITAYEVGQTEKINLKTALEKFTGKHLKINYIRKKEVIGGLIFKFGDMHIDYSLRGALDEIRDKLEKVTLP